MYIQNVNLTIYFTQKLTQKYVLIYARYLHVRITFESMTMTMTVTIAYCRFLFVSRNDSSLAPLFSSSSIICVVMKWDILE